MVKIRHWCTVQPLIFVRIPTRKSFKASCRHYIYTVKNLRRHKLVRHRRGNWNCTRQQKLKLSRGTRNWNCTRHQKLKLSRGTRNWNCTRHKKLKLYAAPETEIVRGTRNWNCTRHLGIFSMSASVMGWRHSSSSTSAASRLFILVNRKNRIEIRVPDPDRPGFAKISLS